MTIGKEAPHFRLPNQDGIETSLRDYEGKWVVLYFYPKDDTPGCTTQACEFTAALEDFKKLDAVVFGVSADSASRHQKFIDKHNIGFSLLCDEDHEVMKAYGAFGEKKLYGKTYQGIIRSTFIIDPAGTLAAAWSSVRVKGHVQKVQDKLTKLRR